MKSRKSTNRAMKSNTVKKREANGREAKDRAVARTPLWSRILIGIVAMACLCAGIAAGANLIAVTAFDDATSQLNGNLKAASSKKPTPGSQTRPHGPRCYCRKSRT